MDYLIIILGFSATIIGIIGNTWDEKRNGYKKLTKTGWIAFIIALISLLFSIIKTNENNRNKKAIEKVVMDEMKLAVSILEEPVQNLYLYWKLDKGIDTLNKQEISNELKNINLSDTSFVYYIDNFNLLHNPKIPTLLFNNQSWAEYILLDFERALKIINTTLAVNSGFLNPEELLIINNLKSQRFINDILSIRNLIYVSNKPNLEYITSDGDDYSKFVLSLNEIKTIID